ncbi:MAG: T9SS type A sorting domain-containing protein, partial [candidate division WOR-3 bacterium]|nr:T9SS type A sorting domain-containing protein [candidate division WOR-3 bacterium]
GSFETKCTTQLFDDMNTSNDRQVGSVFVGFLDVGTIAILSPPAIVDSGQMITPQAIVKNFGNIVANNIPVRFTVDIWQHDTVIISLVPNESIIVSFAPWTAQQRGDFALKCSTLLAGDNNRANDKQTGSVFVAVSDIGAIAILTPPAAIDSGQTANPQAIVKNFGNILLGYIPVRFSIGNWHHDTTIINLVPDESTIVTFANWTATQRGTSAMKCSTRFMGDMQNSNDKFEDSILVRVLDVGAKEIVAPIDSIIKDSIFTPKAIAKNYGNTQADIAVYFTILKEPDTIYKKTTNIFIEPLQELEISFGDTLLDSIGIYQTAFWTEFIGDMHPENNLVFDNFRVYIPIPPQERVWIRMADIPDMPSGRAPKRGSCMAGLEATGKIYYLKASNTQDFHIYFPELGTWANAETIPKGNKEDGDGKKPKRGSSMTGYEPTKSVYILRGNNTVGFWKYQADTLGDTIMPGWYKLTNIPLGAKKCKYGSGLTVVNKSGKDYIFTMKGSRTSEFYLYDIANDSWTQVSSPPVGPSGKRGYKKGSCLAYDENGFVYVLKSYYGDFFKYSVEGDSWYLLRRYDPKVFRNRYGKKKKVKEGAGIVYYNNSVYLLKGGNTYEFWKYDIAADDWFQMDEYWDIPSGSGKKVKGGGALIKFGEYFYASKGSKTFEFYRHILPTGAIAPIKTPPTFEGVLEHKSTNAEFKLLVTPNPAVNYILLKYNLPKNERISLRLYNICGELVKTYNNSNLTKAGVVRIDTKEFSAGIYILRFTSSKVNATRKLVIEK